MFFLQNIVIAVTSYGQIIKITPPTNFFNIYLMFCYLTIHSLVSSNY